MEERGHITIQDIANEVGVSKTTISRYLNGKFNYMSEETRWRIEKVIKETGFRPNKMAGSLKTSRSDLIGLVIPDASSMMTPYLISSICDECLVNGRKAIVVSCHDDEAKERRLVHALLDHQVDGIITATAANIPFYQKLDKGGIPVVLTDRMTETPVLDTVVVDHQKSCERAANCLLDHGFRRIVFLLRESKDGYGTFAPREKSIAQVCERRKEEGARFEKELVKDSIIGDFYHFRRQLQEIYRRCGDLPTAVFVAEGLLMGHVTCAFAQLGLRLSSRFTIAGYDDTRVAATCMDQALVLNQPLTQMGTMATRILISRIEGRMNSEEKIRCFLDCAMSIPQTF